MSTSRYLTSFLLVLLLLTVGVYLVQADQIEPLTPPETESILDCRECHWDVYLRWEQSAHGRGLSCGQCQLGMTSQKGCDLAVRIEGESYFVDGADINEFGNAHDENTGFCEVIRKAEIEGEIIDHRMKVSSVKLLD